ncbi:MAG: Glu-tRNA(Gln) amidotransferase subunit GatE [Candidatus Woesearchaeota archaeon]|jgi:Glu-tRNA(Gln) amidotransferase subunit E-like FAD-binding protein|nr:Glu-tRNA(Gln) amidotransferase subunit GatE [Candidatus Woesearchaeota archaeon]MDP7622563.1 Glu-tRNA(Gln) amidotransferase subunit GatE [Candidatus Woesearchaeota archaeon]HJN57275.1 Glu-tRNA(Gln) amidotransferase subunit GatE [Candidatus Woesearchaeota archaeon]|tara:strand:+ start:5342 stop:6784 length:1443 start_codon:yes stop_codon:yes gene_type:complete
MPNMEVNYNELGFKCGLEIHQQLEGKKLFCNCPTINSDNDPNVKFERRLRAVAGETGEIDIAAKHEMQKKKKFIYEADSSDTCLIEYDEQPPNELNRKALETAIKVALLLNAKITDEIQVMRKTVVDGSNVSGFQRTALIAVNGFIETSQGKVTIPIICLEEEAAKKQEEGNDFVRYRLDRLGIPLIEIATGSEIKNPEHAKETASHIGMVLRSVENIKRGLGTIRQDVNTSITKGERTEIKGFQDLKSIPKVIEYEIKRQLNSIKNSKKINKEVRKAEPDLTTSFLRPMPGAARLYPETDCSPVKIKKEYIEKLKKELPKLKSERLEEFQKKHNILQDLAKELIDNPNYETYVKNFKKLNSQLIAYYLINVPKEIKKRFKLDITKLQDKDFEEVLGYLNERKINDDGAIDIFIKKIKNEKIDFDKFSAVSEKELDKEIKKIIEEKKGLSIGAYMGILMGKYRGKADGKKIMEILKKYLN